MDEVTLPMSSISGTGLASLLTVVYAPPPLCMYNEHVYGVNVPGLQGMQTPSGPLMSSMVSSLTLTSLMG